jgi:hypothetical protein
MSIGRVFKMGKEQIEREGRGKERMEGEMEKGSMGGERGETREKGR